MITSRKVKAVFELANGCGILLPGHVHRYELRVILPLLDIPQFNLGKLLPDPVEILVWQGG